MKYAVAFLCGAVLASGVVYFICGLRSGVRELRFMSEIETPLRICFDDIATTFDNGDAKLAEAKLRLLCDKWHEYLEHRGFLGDIHIEIMELTVDNE